MSLYFNLSVRYSQNALKNQCYYPDLVELQNACLTYSLWFECTCNVKLFFVDNKNPILKIFML